MDNSPSEPLDLEPGETLENQWEDERRRVLDSVEVACEAILGAGKITIGRLETLSTGDTLVLDCSPADPVELRINGKPIALGEIVTVDNRFGVRITQIGG